jgi:hypothetical protein
MPKVRAGGDKWKQRTAAAQQDYARGVQSPRRSWAQATAEAQSAWEQGVQEATARGSFQRGVQEAGDGAWQNGVQSKGVQRFAAGVTASGNKYEQGFAPYRQVIEGIQRPARGRRGDPANLQRVSALNTALHEARRARKGS